VNRGIGGSNYYADRYGDRDWRFYGPVLGSALTHSAPGPILDIGAGHGLLVECALRWGLQCVGVDGSDHGVALAAARGIELIHSQLSEVLPFRESTFQTAFMNQVIEHLEPPVARRALDEGFRVLRPGGMIYVASPSRFNAEQRVADPTHINLLAPSELHAMLRAAGFVDLRPFDKALYGRLGEIVFNRIQFERLSSSANCLAFKPAATQPRNSELA
jgi:SAM-dependent methyltransferase